MVTTTDFYVLRFQFMYDDVEAGISKKVKRDILAECANYTDAEKLAFLYIEDEDMDKHGPIKPEIVRLKISDIKFSACVDATENAFEGITEMYLDDEDLHFYQVDLEDPYEDENGKEKINKESMFIPGKSTSDAEFYAKVLYPDATITSTKIMKFTSAFLLNGTYESIKRDWENNPNF